MARSVIDTLLSILRYELCDAELPKDIGEGISVQELNSLYNLSNHHDLAHIVADTFEKNNLFTEENSVTKAFKQSKIKALYRYLNQEYELEQICSVLEAENIPFIPLKGAVLRKYWKEPYMRTSCDIDILVHEEDVDRAEQALVERLKYNTEANTTLHDRQLFSQGGVHLELHYSLLEDDRMPKTNALLEAVWEHCTPENDTSKYKMSNEMFMYYHVVHMAKHFLNGGCGIRPFIDTWILTQSLELDNESFEKMLESASLSAFYSSTLDLIDSWIYEKPYTNLTREMALFILNGGVYGTLDNSSAVSASRGESKIKSFFKIVFLPRANLEVIYPNLKKHPILLPFYQIKRWFRIFKKDKRRKISAISDSRNSVTEQKKKAVQDLLSKLELE